jgi:hypothetical protein
MRRLATLALFVVLVAGVSGCSGLTGDDAPTASPSADEAILDAKPGSTTGGGTGGSLALAMVMDANGNGLPNYRDRVTFRVTTSATRPFVSLNCYQGTTWVYAASVGFFPDYPWPKEFSLSATSWPGGAAECTATLYTSKDGIRTTTLATLPVHVSP